MDMTKLFEKAGGVTKLARALGRNHATLLGWTRVPDRHLIRVSEITGVPTAELRPDLAQAFAGSAREATP